MTRVLVLCTANQCRSPLGAALLRRRAAERGLAIEVLSAGLGESGHPATEPTVAAAALAGIDLRQRPDAGRPLGEGRGGSGGSSPFVSSGATNLGSAEGARATPSACGTSTSKLMP